MIKETFCKARTATGFNGEIIKGEIRVIVNPYQSEENPVYLIEARVNGRFVKTHHVQNDKEELLKMLEELGEWMENKMEEIKRNSILGVDVSEKTEVVLTRLGFDKIK